MIKKLTMVLVAATVLAATAVPAHGGMYRGGWHVMSYGRTSDDGYLLPMASEQAIHKGVFTGDGILLTVYVVDDSLTLVLNPAVINLTTAVERWIKSPLTGAYLKYADKVAVSITPKNHRPTSFEVSTIEFHGGRLVAMCKRKDQSEECQVLCRLTKATGGVIVDWLVFDELKMFGSSVEKPLSETASPRTRRVIEKICGRGN